MVERRSAIRAALGGPARLDEGDILVETKKLPGVSLTDSVAISKRIEERLRKFPEIEAFEVLQGVGPEHIAGDILHHHREVANFPFRVQNSGLFPPTLAITQQLH